MTTLREVITAVLKDRLRPYQLGWCDGLERHSFAAILGGRQIGKDYTIAFYCVAKALLEPGSIWNTFSASAKHAGQWLEDCRVAYRFVMATAAHVGIVLPELGGPLKDNVTTIELGNGSWIYSNASTVRSAVGLRGSVLLNEIAVLPNAKDMFDAVYPIVEGAIDNGRNGKLMIVSNASRRGTWWHEWFTGAASDGWHKMTTTWEAAVRSMGRRVKWIGKSKAAKIKRLGVGGYAQWYDCKWRASEEGYLPLWLIDRQTWGRPGRLFTPRPNTPQVIGYDIGRHVDPAAWCRLLLADHGEWQGRRVALPTVIAHKMAYRAQREQLATFARERLTYRAVIDSTGSGDETAEECANTMPFEVTQFKFTAQSKQAMFEKLKSGLTDGLLWIPHDDFDLRMELESLTATYSAGGVMRIDVPREGGGHGDRAIALALAEYGCVANDTGFFDAAWGNIA